MTLDVAYPPRGRYVRLPLWDPTTGRYGQLVQVAGGAARWALQTLPVPYADIRARALILKSQSIHTTSPYRTLTGYTIADGGTGYAPGDLVELVGGVYTQAARVTVATVGGGGAVLTVTITTAGNYSTVPSNPVATNTLTGGGSGLTLNATWDAIPSDQALGPHLITIETATATGDLDALYGPQPEIYRTRAANSFGVSTWSYAEMCVLLRQDAYIEQAGILNAAGRIFLPGGIGNGAQLQAWVQVELVVDVMFDPMVEAESVMGMLSAVNVGDPDDQRPSSKLAALLASWYDTHGGQA